MPSLAYLLDRYYVKQPRLRQFLTRLIYGDKDTTVDLLGTRLRVNSIKENGYLRAAHLAGRSSLLRDELAVLINLARVLSDGDTFVDIGANVGVFSLTFSRFRNLHPACQFYAFEANPDTFARLAVNARKQGIIVENIALSDHEGTLSFIRGAVSHVFTTVENRSDYNLAEPPVQIPCRRLDQTAIEGDSIVLKVDVEGQELNVLKGAEALFEAGRIKAVYLDGYKHTEEVESLLRRKGFTFREGRTLQPTSGGVFSLLALRNPSTPAKLA